jgi:ketosteroid isomerase-like protein
MSSENVRVVEAMWDVFRRGGFPTGAFSEDVAWYVAPDVPESGPGSKPLRGPEEIRQMLASGWETVSDPWLKTDEVIDRGDRVVVRWRGGGIGRGSEIPVEWHETHVYSLKDGKVCEVREYRDFGDALESVELSEPGD